MQIKEINELAQYVLSCSDKDPDFRKLIEDYDYFDDVYGYLTEENALALLTESVYRRELRSIVGQMFFFCNIYSVSETVFSAIMSIKKKRRRNDILISLAHCKISIYQLEAICRENICIEAFATLLDIYLNEPCFSAFDLSKLLHENTKLIHTIEWDMVLAKELDPDKRDVLQKALSSQHSE